MALFKVHSTGATYFARNYVQLQQLREALPKTTVPRVVWMVGVGGGDEIELMGERRHANSIKRIKVGTIAGINTETGPMTPIEHHELACMLSPLGPFEMHVMEVSAPNLKLAQAGVTQEQLNWVKRNTTEPSMIVGNPIVKGRSLTGLQAYAKEFLHFLDSPASGTARKSTQFYHADATKNHPPSEPPDLIVCHNAFIRLNAATKLEPLLKALSIGGTISIGVHEQPAFRLNPLQRQRYGLKKVGQRIYVKTRGPVEQLPSAQAAPRRGPTPLRPPRRK